jgi:hypothetical protein
MPAASRLPEDIRSLHRLQAIELDLRSQKKAYETLDSRLKEHLPSLNMPEPARASD